MPEDVLFNTESEQSRAEIATTLRTIADKLDEGAPITLTHGDQTVTIDPPQRPTFEIKAERETARDSDTGELSIEFELEWDENQTNEGSLDIE